ncbi:9221_t:CDS:10 [Ambispora leptoticha]|uniref:eIF-2-alpha kinase activator GCN1 n=1 Tax=Ambispora leptoticha TaxID=144679 RepID=A0A9N8WMT3_9GLOM|nr:9221_t:CDS:10 [Ambispora leptoticha]
MEEVDINLSDLTWADFIKNRAPYNITSSNTNRRIEFLNHALLPRIKAGGLSVNTIGGLLHLVLLTYPRYSDRKSRLALINVLKELYNWNSSLFLEYFVPSLVKETEMLNKKSPDGKYSTSSANRFVLLTWVNSLINFVSADTLELSSELLERWTSLIDLQAVLLDSIVNDKEIRKSITHGALVDVRKCVRKNPTKIPSIISHLTQPSKTNNPPLRNAVLLGTVIDSALRLRKENGKAFILNVKDNITQFYLTQIVSSKAAIPEKTADALHDFIRTVITEQHFITKFLPVFEKMLLRAPEIVLNVLKYNVKALSFDTSTIFKNNFLQPLLGYVGSTNKSVQTGAIDVLNVLLEKSQKPDVVVDIIKETIKTLNGGKVTNPEHRGFLIQTLGRVRQSPITSKNVIEGLLPIIAKEMNEQSLSRAIATLKIHVSLLLRIGTDEDTINKITQATIKGLTSNKVAVRKAWAIMIGSVIWEDNITVNEPSSALLDITKKSLSSLLTTLDNIQANPLNFPGGPLEGYIVVAIAEGRARRWKNEEIDSLIRAKKLPQSIFTVTPKPSFWLWDKVYSKLSSYEEGLWFVRSLEGVLLEEDDGVFEKKETKNVFATAYIYLISSTNEHQTRRVSFESLARCNQIKPILVNSIIREGLTRWLLNLEKNTKDSTAVLATNAIQPDENPNTAYRLSRILTAITTFSKSTEINVIETSLIEIVLLAHHRSIVSPSDKYNWISLVQRAGLNPGKLIKAHHSRLKEIITEKIDTENEAAMSTISTLSFISPDTFIPLFLAQCHNDLDSSLMTNIGEQEIKIWKTPEGTLFVDVLKRNKKNVAENRNRKDYQTEKWEREVREEIAKKKGATKAANAPKLSKDEQAAVNAQLAKESKIRKQVQEVHFRYIRGLDIIKAMIKGNAENLKDYVAELMRLLTFVVKNGRVLVGDKAIETYLQLGLCTTENLSSIRVQIGVATLRAMEISEIPEHWLEEPLGHLVTRVLYGLRIVTERNPLPAASFSYCFSLIYQVIHKGGFLNLDNLEKDTDLSLEQVAFSLDIISFHSVIGYSPLIPRSEMIECLMHIIKEYPKLTKTAKSALVDLCQSMGDTAKKREIDTLLAGLLYPQSLVRNACLQGLEFLDLTDFDFSRELWVSCFDEDESNAKLANALWEDNGMDVEPNYALELLPLLIHNESFVRVACSKAIGSAVEYFPSTISDTLNLVYDLYKEKAQQIGPQYNEFGMIIPESLNVKDPWEARAGLALTLSTLAPSFTPSELIPFYEFLIVEKAVGDINADAGLAVINAHGAANVTVLMSIFQKYLDTPAAPSETHDRIRESVVIWFGALARHLDTNDTRIPIVIDKLLETLKTPSEVVQTAVADCLPPLIKTMKDSSPNLISGLLNQLFGSEKYAERKGAAFGLAGIIKGTGISALKDCNIMTSLKENIGNKKDYKCRQGALFAFEALSQSLGRLFEPYIIQILPLLLTCFGDSHPDVREATSDTARVIMSKISGHCVKLILPSLLAGLEDRQWRTKKGSVELLGSMAFCAPKQLSISLPTIVPRLTEVLMDSHTQVQAAANEALLRFGEVISNPEVQELVPTLLHALSDPDKNTNAALNALLETAFVHYIDAPSLALVMPILERGLKERSTDVKKKSSQIVGNMASLTDVKDLVPYLPKLLPGLKEVLVDPVPEARATAAKALGTLVEKLGEDKFPSLVSELTNTLKSDTSGVDRQGAAQGLSEVLAGLGLERLEGLLPEILNNTESSKSYVREGFISLLIYLPATFGLRFQPYLGRIIPPILAGLADDSEYVREASLRAGQMIVVNYATKAVDLLLPELERGLFDDNWRIRHSSVQLMGDLLYRITGISGKTPLEGDEDETVGETGSTEAGRKALLQILGKERRDRILASLYIIRQDGVVRQASMHVWKAIVSNTPRTIKDILPIMMTTIIRNLASHSSERRQVAARTLGELVRKLGDNILSEIIPILEGGLESSDPDTRQGVCVGLSETMSTASKIQVIEYTDSFVPAVRKALVDESGEVREAAAQAFDILHQHVGQKAIDEIIPTLLNSLKSGKNSDYALEAFKELMAVRANVVFPVLIPTLIAVPIDAFNARALSTLVSVAGPTLNKRLTSILTALMTSINLTKDETIKEALRETERTLILSIDNAEGLQTLMMMLFETVKSEEPSKRFGACEIITMFFMENRMDVSRYVPEWIRVLISLLDDRVHEVVKSAWNALNAVTKSLKKDELEPLIIPVRRAVKAVGVPGVNLPGFCLPKGISPILPIFIQGLQYGTPEIREQSALGMGDIIQRTSPEALQSFAAQMAGPLIRIVSDRYPSNVKAAILQTLSLLLNKIPLALKPFIPQLQRAFIKSLADTSSSLVRSRAASALGILISLQSRVDPLISELVTGVTKSEPDVRETMLDALESVISKAGELMSENSKKNVTTIVVDSLSENTERVIVAAARVLGTLCKNLRPDEAESIIKDHVLRDAPASYGALLAINAILAESPTTFEDLGLTDNLVDIIINSTKSNQPVISDTAILAAGKMLLTTLYQNEEIIDRLVEALINDVKEPPTSVADTKRLALTVFRAFARKHSAILEKYLPIVVPPLLISARDRNTSVKLVAEQALVYALQLLDGEAVLQEYLSTTDAQTNKNINEFARHNLAKVIAQEKEILEQSRANHAVGFGERLVDEDSEIWEVGNMATAVFDDE